MDNKLIEKLFPILIRTNGQAEIFVTGVSMNPTLYEGDQITVCQCDNYKIGDILVFTYKSAEFLVHRFLRKQKYYFCKGDNAFRLENVEPIQILGKVTAVNGKAVMPWPGWKIELSYQVNREFFCCRYNIDKTKESQVYRLYHNLIFRKEGDRMMYKKNEKMDYVQTDETSLAVFDAASGDTHFFDETGIDILNVLSEPCTLEQLLGKLCSIYDADPEDIRPDVEEFLAETVSQKVVEVV